MILYGNINVCWLPLVRLIITPLHPSVVTHYQTLLTTLRSLLLDVLTRMRSSSVFSFAALAAFALASPVLLSTHAVHEKRSEAPQGWAKTDLLDPHAVLPMRVGLTQSNLHKGYGWLEEVSDPSSPKYGQHWDAKQVSRTKRHPIHERS